MPLKIVRNDITKMQCDAIVNTANTDPIVGPGCDYAVYKAAGYDRLIEERQKIGSVPEGEVFLTSGFDLPAKYIIHAVSPLFIDGTEEEEKKLRSCYKKSLALAAEKGCTSIAFPLISTGSFGYPKEEGMLIAVSEINAFLMKQEMLVYLVVFGDKMTDLGKRIYPGLQSYIDKNYVSKKIEEEYMFSSRPQFLFVSGRERRRNAGRRMEVREPAEDFDADFGADFDADFGAADAVIGSNAASACLEDEYGSGQFETSYENQLKERMQHLEDSFSEYLLYLIKKKGMKNSEVYKRAIVDRKMFSKIKNNPDYHVNKMTAMCLCMGARLNLDETKDLLGRAGYALSPCDKTDVIFSFFIANKIYDMMELDIQLENYGLHYLIG